jgi:photosystem I subunit 3
VCNPNTVFADVSGLTTCKDSAVFNRRLEESTKKLQVRMEKYLEGTPTRLALENQIYNTQLRFEKYSKQGLLCGSDGLPHLIVDGRFNHAGEFIEPGILFLYIAGYIGWTGRSYLQFAKQSEKSSENEIIINVPVAIGIMSASFLWPIAAWKELVSGDLIVPANEVTISPR